MTLSPRKYVSNYTTCTSHRGVEAKDVELADARSELSASHSSPLRAESGASCAPVDETASYLQVVVERHRGGRAAGGAEAAAQTSPRLPSASSPIARAMPHQGGSGVYVLPHPVLLACPTASPLYRALRPSDHCTRCGPGHGAGEPAPPPAPPAPPARGFSGAGDAGDGDTLAETEPPAVQKVNKPWKMFRDVNSELYDNEPELVEVYYFEQGAGAWLATGGAARASWCERAARRPARALGAALREALGALSLGARAPLAALLAAQRAALLLARGAVAGAVQAGSDYALKPALALAYNALLRPLLVFASNVARGLRAALRPLAGAAGDALEPAARLLRAARLVDVRLACACPHCARPSPHSPH